MADHDLRPDATADDLLARAPPGSLKAGTNTRVETTDAGQEFYATADGNVQIEGDEIRIVPLLVVNSDIGYETGNLDFEGDIYVKGGIGCGYTVKAGGSVIVAGIVGEGSSVMAKGDVTICRGIEGRKTKVIAVGDVRTMQVLEATVHCAGDLTAGNHVKDAQLRCGGLLTVDKGEGSLGGTIAGGQSWGRKGVEVHRAGSPSGASTALNAGLQPDQAGQLDALKKKMGELGKQIDRLLARFNLKVVDVPQIQKMIAASTGPQRKMLARAAKQLGELLQANKKLLDERSDIEGKMSQSLAGAKIKIAEQVYPGVEVRLGDHKRRLKEAAEALLFYVEGEEMRETSPAAELEVRR